MEKYDTNFGFSQISLSASLASSQLSRLGAGTKRYDKFPVAIFINSARFHRSFLPHCQQMRLLRPSHSAQLSPTPTGTLFHNLKFSQGINIARGWLFCYGNFEARKSINSPSEIGSVHAVVCREKKVENASARRHKTLIQILCRFRVARCDK